MSNEIFRRRMLRPLGSTSARAAPLGALGAERHSATAARRRESPRDHLSPKLESKTDGHDQVSGRET